jgi:hypothetical protein
LGNVNEKVYLKNPALDGVTKLVLKYILTEEIMAG